MLLLSPNALAFNVALYSKLPYDTLRDFSPISLVADQPNILVVNPALPASGVRDDETMCSGLRFVNAGPLQEA